MIAEPLVKVRCAVCAGGDCAVICAAREVRAQREYLRRFRCRRLRPGAVLAVSVLNGECFRWDAAWMRRLPHPLGGWLRAAIAWNNLLAFPYLHGYSVRTLDWLLACHGFGRIS